MNIFRTGNGIGRQILIVLTSTIGLLSNGMDYGWTSPTIPILLDPKRRPFATHVEACDGLEAYFLLGMFVGLPIAAYILDKFGRKRTMICGYISKILSWTTIATAKQIEYLYVARFIAGVADCLTYVSTIIYCSEIADKMVRGCLSSFPGIMLELGIVIMYCVGPFTSYLIPPIISCCFSLTTLILITFLPESPYFLIQNKTLEHARLALKKIRGNKHYTDAEFSEIGRSVEENRRAKFRLRDIFNTSNRKPLILLTVLMILQNFSGITIFIMNIHTILESAGAKTMSPSIVSILFASIMTLASILTSLNIDKYGRKALIILSSSLTAICLLIFSVYLNVKLEFPAYDLTSVSWIPLIAVMSYGGVYMFGLGVIPMILATEMFPIELKAIGSSYCTGLYAIVSVSLIQFYLFISRIVPIYLPFYCFAGCNLLTIVFVVCYLPETRCKSFRDIQDMLTNNDTNVDSSTKLLESNIKNSDGHLRLNKDCCVRFNVDNAYTM